MPTTTVTITPDTQGFDAALDAIAKSLDAFAKGPVTDSAHLIENAVNGSFNAVANTIARAVTSGKLSMDSLVNAILADFDRIAVKDFIAKPIEGLIAQLASSLFSISGARAGGGPVDAGLAYLVGEQGPELFVPQSAGAIMPNGAMQGSARPQIVMNVQARDAGSFLKSETQIAAMLSRALARGQRNL
ncbi:MAG TPA: phage tail tape measure C-terminal domain-containing protein [Rhizomicrobium sp.]|nr:phage tail tape measure C-terminal domain-containing protein [Rhizomicrobium sp.]